jgi:hypothetical protein
MLQKYPDSFHTVLYFSSLTVVIMRLFANYIFKNVNKKFIWIICSKNYYLLIKKRDGWEKKGALTGEDSTKRMRES